MSGSGGARLARVPVDHIEAELAAFPLASAAALRLHPSALDGSLADTSGALWRAAETELLGGFPGLSVDELVHIRDSLWFPAGRRGPRPLHAYLHGLAGRLLEVEGDVARPRAPDTAAKASGELPVRARHRWRWFGFALPGDLLLAALGTPGGGPHRVEVLVPWLERHLAEAGYAESHLHVGAGLDFPLLWTGTLHALGQGQAYADLFASPGAALDDGRQLASWLVRAAIARYLLAAFLGRRDGCSFAAFLDGPVREQVEQDLGLGSSVTLRAALGDLAAGRLGSEATFSELRLLYRHLSGVGGVALPETVAEALQADPIGPLLRPSGWDTRTPELRFVSGALAYLREQWTAAEGYADAPFATLFWQVARIRSLYFRHVTQRPLTPGLQWFIRFYGRGSAGRTGLTPRLQARAAARLGGKGRGLRALEVRTSPPASVHELLGYATELRALAREWQQTRVPGPELGLVLHFIKTRGGAAAGGLPSAHEVGSHADPCTAAAQPANPTGYRYATLYGVLRRQATSVEWLLRHLPHGLAVLRGVDVCSDELAVPDWVIAPLFERVRCAARDAQACLARTGVRVPMLRATAHMGEDFPHLLTGLRRVDQGIDALRLGEGDRLGHGLALGIDPQDWGERAGRVPLPREVRLFDLAWEWGCYARRVCNAPHSRVVQLDDELYRLSRECFGEAARPQDILQLVEDLRDPWLLYRAGFPDGQAVDRVDAGSGTRWGRLLAYLRDPEVFDCGRVVEWVDPGVEVEILSSLQAAGASSMGIAALCPSTGCRRAIAAGRRADR